MDILGRLDLTIARLFDKTLELDLNPYKSISQIKVYRSYDLRSIKNKFEDRKTRRLRTLKKAGNHNRSGAGPLIRTTEMHLIKQTSPTVERLIRISSWDFYVLLITGYRAII